jgi:folate-dependent phosphoribosylglycinamide formyltransferase PurN
MKTLLICHESSSFDRELLARWLQSFSNLVGLVCLQDPAVATWRRARREIKRVGIVRFADVLAFRLYYRGFRAARDNRWEQQKIEEFCRKYGAISADTLVLKTPNANAPETEEFIKGLKPDLVIARCKTILKERVFSIPASGTFVMHPGICPEYRNAHGCFWALANRDLTKVGITLLRVDRGVDTGPVFGYYTYPFDEVGESHIVIQQRAVLENLDALQAKLISIFRSTASPVDTAGRPSGSWGQPWLSKYMSWKAHARKIRK